MFSRQFLYETWAPSQEAVDRASRQLTNDLRGQIRKLALYEPLTDAWTNLADTVHQVAVISRAEINGSAGGTTTTSSSAAPAASAQKPSTLATTRGSVSSGIILGGGSSGSRAPASKVSTSSTASTSSTSSSSEVEVIEWTRKGSIWDREDLVVRLLLEEGKLNAALRMMVDFAAFQCVGEDFAKARQSDPARVETLTRMFESDMGAIIASALSAIEAVQTIDLPLLFEYIAHVLTHPNQTAKLDAMIVGEEIPATWAIQTLASVLAATFGLPDDADDTSVRSTAGPGDGGGSSADAERLRTRVSEQLQQYGLLGLVVRVLAEDQATGRIAFSHRTVHAVASICSSVLAYESYPQYAPAYWGMYLVDKKALEAGDPSLKSELNHRYKALQATLVDRLGPLSGRLKKRYRPVLDAVLQSKYAR